MGFYMRVISILWNNGNENIIERFLLDNDNTLLKNNVYQEIALIRKLISLNREGILIIFMNY